MADSNDSTWGWCDITEKNLSKSGSAPSVKTGDTEYEVVNESSNIVLAHHINDQYLNLSDHEFVNSATDEEDDDEATAEIEQKESLTNEDNKTNLTEYKHSDDADDTVLISQTLTLRDRNEELQKERDGLYAETLQLRIQLECLKQTNKHLIEAQQKQIENLESKNDELQTKLTETQEQLKSTKDNNCKLEREKSNLQKKVEQLVNGSNRSDIENMMDSIALIVNKGPIYCCNQCGQYLFDHSAVIQRQIQIDSNMNGCLVDRLLNTNDVTMGPTVCKTFLNGMFKVKEVFCDGCLDPFGWKIIESFDEWNSFHQNKYCIISSNIKTIGTNAT